VRATEAYKDSIGFASAAILQAGSGLRLVTDFQSYGVPLKSANEFSPTQSALTRPNP